MTRETTLIVDGLSKRFEAAGALERALTLGRAPRHAVEALNNVDLRVAPGEIVGLIGPNGSGKTTLLRCAAGLLSPSAGTVRVSGVDPVADSPPIRGRIGLVIRDDRAFHLRLSGRENLRLFARLQQLPRTEADARIADVLHGVQLDDVADRPYRTYSAGMRQRLGYARALLGDPVLLLLDEVTTGLDPGLKRAFVGDLKRRTDAGAAVLYATHDMNEARDLCDRVVVLQSGAVVARGAFADVEAQANAVFGLEAPL